MKVNFLKQVPIFYALKVYLITEGKLIQLITKKEKKKKRILVLKINT